MFDIFPVDYIIVTGSFFKSTVETAPAKAMTEKIVCFRESLLPESAAGGRVFYDAGLWDSILANLETVPRGSAENDPSFRQLVVYALINSGGRFLSYKRTPKTTEDRLRSRKSIGIGGHVNAGDETQLLLFNGAGGGSFIREALWREVNEEVKLNSSVLSEPELICFINDDSTEVGRVHFGIAWMVRMEEPAVSLRGEKGIGGLEFLGLRELEKDIDSYENWSKLMIKHLRRGYGRF